jgi:hypothetical protein
MEGVKVMSVPLSVCVILSESIPSDRSVKFDIGDFHRKLHGNFNFPLCGFIRKPT